jgi:hypothetical protein
MMQNSEQIISEINLDGCPEGAVLQPLEYQDEIRDKYFAGWETPLAPWGGFGLNSGLSVVKDDSRQVLEWAGADRAIVAGSPDMRNYKVIAEVKPIDTTAKPNDDRMDYTEAIVGIVFRIKTSRHYYQFGIEGSYAVLYRRSDDEWFALAEQEVDLDNDYVSLEVNLDGDAIHCRCRELDVNFFCTCNAFHEGKAGIRAIGKARVGSLKITQTSLQKSLYDFRQKYRQEEKSENIPNPELVRVLDLSKIGGSPQFNDFVIPNRYDMLVSGKTLRAMTFDGQLLWETPLKVDGIVFSHYTDKGRLIYGFMGGRKTDTRVGVTGGVGHSVVSDEMIVIRGSDGEVLARTKIPELDSAVRITAFTVMSGNLSGSGAYDIILREWRSDCGDGGINLWAYDKNLNLLWHNRVNAPYGHGNAVQFVDMDSDGKDEVLAGGTLFSPDGNILWIHDREVEMAKIPGAHHYDAVAVIDFSEEALVEKPGPVAFLMGGSAGVYVVDGLTGRTRMIHRVGHAQGRSIGKVRKDLPGKQVLVACRWGNMGILNLFSGYGDRLWTIQPDYIGQGASPVTWGNSEEQLIWTNTSGQVQALYDGHGCRVKVLHELRKLWGNRMRKDVGISVNRMGDDPTELLCLAFDGKMYAFGH